MFENQSTKNRKRKIAISYERSLQRIRTTSGGKTEGNRLYAFVITALYTGARLDELQHLEWTDIDWSVKKVTVQNKPSMNWNSKSGENCTLGVNDMLIKALREFRSDQEALGITSWSEATTVELRSIQRPRALCRYERPPGIQKLIRNSESVVKSLELQINSPLVFPNSWGGIHTEFPRGYWEILDNLSLQNTGVNFHMLRHTYASHLAQAGVDMQSLNILMGHASIVTTMRYAHLAADHASKKGVLMPTF